MPESREDIIGRMRKLRKDIAGPGMGGSIRGMELAALLDEIDELTAAQARGQKAARRSARRAAATAGTGEPNVDDYWTAPLAEVVPAVADILENHAELWGRPLTEALDAWGEQQTFVVPETWAPAVEKALSGGE